MEELHFVYINANGRIGVHSVQSISYSENHIQGICKNTDRIKTFRKDRILKQYDSPEQAIQECASFLPENYSHLTKQSGPKKIHSMCASPDLRKQIKKDWLIRRMNKD